MIAREWLPVELAHAFRWERGHTGVGGGERRTCSLLVKFEFSQYCVRRSFFRLGVLVYAILSVPTPSKLC